jgi:hypothetical protein
MAATTNKHFLDYAGLSTLWSIITNRFADKDKTITSQEVSLMTSTNDDDATRGKQTWSLVTTLADGATEKVTELPLANRVQPGLMTPDQFTMIDDLTANIEEMAPFAGLQLKNDTYVEEVSLTGRKATIELKYDSALEDGVRKAYISLLDPTYPAEGEWQDRTKEQFIAAKDAAAAEGTTLVGWADWTDSANNETYYYQWSVAGKTGPVNALGKPIKKKPISKIDVTDLLRTGLLENTDVISKGGKTMLKLDFIVKSPTTGNEEIQSQYIDVTDLVDIYTAGDGIKIVSRTSEPTLGADGELDYKATETEIALKYATDGERGAIRTGYTAAEGNVRHYAIDVVDGDDDTTGAGKAFVVVPWDNHEVTVFSEGVDANENPYLTIKDTSNTVDGADGSKTHKHTFQIEVADGIKQAEALARTAAQNIYGDSVTTGEGDDAVTVNYINVEKFQIVGSAEKGEGTNWTITLDQTVKDSLALADSAVQSVAVEDVERDGRSTGTDLAIELVKDPAGKGEKGYTITLGERTRQSLEYADSAVQTVTLFNTTLNGGNDVVYSEEQLTEDIKLGSAIKANVSSTISKSDNSTDTSESSYVNAETGEKDVKDNLPTVKAVKTYVESVKTDITQEYESHVTGVVNNLNSDIEVDNVDAGNTAQNLATTTFFTKIAITKGMLDADASESRPLVIKDITDFRALDEDEIYAICGATKPTPEA